MYPPRLGPRKNGGISIASSHGLAAIWNNPSPPHFLSEELLSGIGGSGTGFLQQLYHSHDYFLRALMAFKKLSPTQKQRFADHNSEQAAWDFAAWLDTLPIPNNSIMRNILLFLLYPDYFERMISTAHKGKITEHFGPLLEETAMQRLAAKPDDLLERDKAIYEIRAHLEDAYQNEIVDFYLEPIRVDDHWINVDQLQRRHRNRNRDLNSPSPADISSEANSKQDALRFEDLEDKHVSGLTEGEKRLVSHYVRERKPKLRKHKLDKVMRDHGHLLCECCGTTGETYRPEVRRSLFEVHHRKALADGTTINGLKDLALLCANCHRAIHAATPLKSVEKLRYEMLPET